MPCIPNWSNPPSHVDIGCQLNCNVSSFRPTVIMTIMIAQLYEREKNKNLPAKSLDCVCRKLKIKLEIKSIAVKVMQHRQDIVTRICSST